MDAIRNLGFEIYKNFKLIFRNWSSLVLIIIAPLLLILLVGYSFSGDDLHDIKIGIIAQEHIDLSEFSQNVSSFAEITNYDDVNDCIFAMMLEKSHICLEISGSFVAEPGEIPTGEVVFYYDNTRKKVSLLLLSSVKDFFGLTAERISLVSTEAIFDNLQSLLGFLTQRIDDIDQIRNESEKIQSDLIARKQRLSEVRDDFRPKYLLVKSAQADVNATADAFSDVSGSLLSSVEDLKNITTILTSSNITVPSATLQKLEQDLDNTANLTNATIQEITRIRSSLDDVVVELDTINDLLDEEIERTDEYIILINQSLVEIDAIAIEAKEKMQDLSKLDPSFAAKIVKPITQRFKALIQNITDVQLAFPVLLSTVIIFISILFSNIITLLEINDKAYVRNILAPVDDFLFTGGLVLTNFIIVFFQGVVLLIVAQTRFTVDVFSHLSSLIPLLVILIIIFVFLGMILAYLSRSMQTSILLATFVALGFFLFSTALNALEAMPVFAAQIAGFNPLVIVNTMFRQILFFDITLSQLQGGLGLLLVYLVGMGLLLIVISKRKNKERF